MRLIEAAHQLGERVEGMRRIVACTHMLGYGGHFSSKTRRYSTTLGALRRARALFQRHIDRQRRGLPEDEDEDPAEVIGEWDFVGVGYLSKGDALLADAIAARAREWRRLAKEEARTPPVL